MKTQRSRKTFLARPFWRDYVLAYVLIGTGFVIGDIAAPSPHDLRRTILLGIAGTLLSAGLAIFLAALLYPVYRRRA